MYRYGRRSLEVLETLHPDLQKILMLVIQRTPTDIGLHEGARPIDKQRQYFKDGASRINPDAYSSIDELCQVAKHITIAGHELYDKSRAVDFHISEKHVGKTLTWDDLHFGVVIGVAMSCAKELLEKGEITHKLRTGGDWDGDGVFVYDQRLKDLPHLELVPV